MSLVDECFSKKKLQILGKCDLLVSIYIYIYNMYKIIATRFA